MDSITSLIVLRAVTQVVSRPFARTRGEMFNTTTALELVEPVIEIETADLQGRAELLRDPQVRAITPPIPIKLIEPRAGTRDATMSDGAPAGEPAPAAWGVTAVGADRSAFTGAGVTVAVLDTGIDRDHVAFAGVSLEEEDFTNSGKGDRKGHGTHCAGTIFGRDINGQRIGVAPGVTRALIGKVLDDSGAGTSESAFRGMKWAVDQGAHVISMSLGFDFPGLVKELTDDNWPVDLATSKALEAYSGNLRMFDTLMGLVRPVEGLTSGAVVVAAAGNESRRDIDPNYEIAASLPAAADGVISVGAFGKGSDGLVVGKFSNSLPLVAAPGIDITSAKVGGGLTVLSGTSMACPHVAGVAALWWEAARTLNLPVNARTVASRLVATTRIDGFDPSVDTGDRGNGLVTAP
jgi:subtilisin family serine protease